ncbi:MAG TPA: MgtC/SapB family protein [Stellaceae bacterium]|jgi:putative Mg2+ transporter-C (MgtC) family protein|nr:MgtC/SapB family protein [Stellaceae bacterium]
MPLHLGWGDIALRLFLTVVAGVLIGYDRSEHGKAAGMRTNVLVCLAAAVAMIQVNLLLPTAGKPADSFVTNDLMRLPLGILTGVGFIGGGAILRRDNIIVGVTTAATLWLVTVVGLCLGGGQLGLGIVATALGILALQGLRWFESQLSQQVRTRLSIMIADHGPSESALRQRLSGAGLSIVGTRVILNRNKAYREFVFELRQSRMAHDTVTPPAIAELAGETGVMKLRWDAMR